jgi:cellulose synthase/poly-beta-1,6-N-acetylglucosamine synthase-like glycosyltransferase
MMGGNYDVVQARVLRKGNSLLSHFLTLDTVIWFWKWLPFILKFARGIPLSGEGLFVKKRVLNEVGYFPEVLTEDAYLGLILTEKNKRFALVDSTIIEKAPKNTRAHLTQKLRWNRGYLTCLRRLFHSNISLKRKFFLLLTFVTPITNALAFLGWLLLIGHWTSRFFPPVLQINAPWMDYPIYKNVFYYWSFLLFYVGIPLSIASCVHTLIYARMRRYALVTIFLPFYWFFLGFCAISSFFRGTAHWGKTER